MVLNLVKEIALTQPIHLLEWSLETMPSVLLHISKTLSVVALLFSLVGSVVRDANYTAYEDDNGALLLTPYIDEGRTDAGREAARVSPLLGTIASYAGYFTVNKEYNSNLFFWYFPAEQIYEKNETAPVILWLNGGPGVTSMYGLLVENGPISLHRNKTYSRRPIYWSKNYHLIYIDNPVGVGFSFTQKNGLLSNETQISKQMHNAIVQFFQLFPDLSKNNFFITGESYAGRYLPPIAYEILRNNPTSKVNINLKGVAIGGGVVDMEVFHKKGVLFAELGLIEQRSLTDRLKLEEDFVNAVKSHDNTTAMELDETLEDSEFIGGVDAYNFLKDEEKPDILESIASFFNDSPFRNHIHVGKVKFHGYAGCILENISTGDGFMNVSPYVEVLLEQYRILYFNGQLDTMQPYPNCEEYTEKLKWSGASKYRQAPRKQWKVGGKLAGFSRSGGNLSLVLVRNAGHMVPVDQPDWALDLITKFVNDQEIGEPSTT